MVNGLNLSWKESVTTCNGAARQRQDRVEIRVAPPRAKLGTYHGLQHILALALCAGLGGLLALAGAARSL